MRSAGTVFVLLATLLIAAVTAVAAHHVLQYLLGRATRRVRGIALAALGVLAVALLVIAMIGVRRRGDPLLSPLIGPVALGSGALLLEYAVTTAGATQTIPAPVTASLATTGVL